MIGCAFTAGFKHCSFLTNRWVSHRGLNAKPSASLGVTSKLLWRTAIEFRHSEHRRRNCIKRLEEPRAALGSNLLLRPKNKEISGADWITIFSQHYKKKKKERNSFKIYLATHRESVAASNLSPPATTTFFSRRKSSNPLPVFAIRARTSAMRVSVAAGDFKWA